MHPRFDLSPCDQHHCSSYQFPLNLWCCSSTPMQQRGFQRKLDLWVGTALYIYLGDLLLEAKIIIPVKCH